MAELAEPAGTAEVPGTAEVAGKESVLLAESVYQRLRDQILSGQLAPGQPLSIPALAAQLNVSRSPVRESVAQLVAEGIATAVPYAGARVAEVDDHAIAGVFELRELLEGLAARHAASSLTTAGLVELERLVDDQRQLLDQEPDEARDALADLRFHAFIRDCSPNETLRDTLARLEAQSHLHRSTMWALETNRRVAVREHAAIVDALCAGDPSEAARAASSHVAGLRVRMTRH